ncbi:T9SS type A sorting domain-containing protein [Flavobacterium pectinovorum]|uniref:T9SS type A sorting domain-containing protein n=1 Tax=Flavobacterium pectinovorum TaxID=29533 RepID=UPI001FABB99A|nr:T9SS type A sorting domain-containing protein [Flavobacterium pectinovorum]
MSAPEGFGAAANGGGIPTPSNTVTVSTFAALKAALQSTTTANSVILVSGTIDCTYLSVLLNDKTIIGLPGAILRNTQIDINNVTTSKSVSGIFGLKENSSNVIFRNLIFQGPAAFDVDGRDLLTNEGTNIWVDHCEFQDGMDGNFDNKGKADNITISWCKFTYKQQPIPRNAQSFTNDHRFSNLIGSDHDDFPTDGHYSITFKNCYWADGCKERMPRARNAELHILNCYYNTTVSGSLAIGLGGGDNNTTCYVENSDFANIARVYQSYSSDGGTIGLEFSGSVQGASSTPVSVANIGTVSKPSYSYTKLNTSQVATYVKDEFCGAGATLQVTPTGVISTNCPNTLGVNDNVSNLELKFYPTVIDNLLNIEFSSIENGLASIEIFSVNGTKVYTSSKSVSGSEKVELNIVNLAKGVYICKVQIENRVKTFKVIKN